MELSTSQIHIFQNHILTWYKKNKRDLPWRQTHDPYRILVSEVMLQQTQVPRVILKYNGWLKAFPTVDALAKASVTDILTYWMGLGYNRRALYLKKCAEEIVRQGGWPQTETDLVRLPGVGIYTARAILCFAFKKQVAVVDTNVKKVILLEVLGKDQKLSEKDFEAIACKLLPEGKAYEWNQALMDYSSAILKGKKITLPKQSKYIGSDRYYRAKVLKLLLLTRTIQRNGLGKTLREDFSNDKKGWLEKILLSLQKDGLIKISAETIELA